MSDPISVRPIEILLVEDNPGDVRLTREAFKDSKLRNNLSVVTDGEKALEFLRKEGDYASAPTPDLVLLDLNLPRLNGQEVLRIIKEDPHLKSIPVAILTSSKEEGDIASSYQHYANCYITKPVDMEQFIQVVRTIENFWFTVVTLTGN